MEWLWEKIKWEINGRGGNYTESSFVLSSLIVAYGFYFNLVYYFRFF